MADVICGNVRRDSEAMSEGVVLLLYWKRVPLKTPMETMAAAEWEDIIVLAMTMGLLLVLMATAQKIASSNYDTWIFFHSVKLAKLSKTLTKQRCRHIQ
jgi:hypothetical protein